MQSVAGRAMKKKKGLQAEACNPLIYYLFCGVADGARTHDNRNHNPGLYQLSYSHHCLTFVLMFPRQVPNYTNIFAILQI